MLGKRLFIIGNGFDSAHKLSTSYEDFRNFLIDKYIGSNVRNGFYLDVPKMRMGHHGQVAIDKEEVAIFLENIISMTEPNGEKWSELEKSLGKIDYGVFFDDFTEVYDKEGDIDLWKTAYNNGDIAADLRDMVPYVKEFFEEWIDTIELNEIYAQKDFVHLINKKSLYLSFNYTETLENIYHIDDENICHIHGKQGQEILFGHGNTINHIEEYEKYYIGAENNLSQLDQILRKDTQFALEQNYSFFEKIDKSIEKIYSVGFSFGEVDLIYIKEICKRLSSRSVWYLNEYDEDKFPKFQKIIRACGFRGRFGSFGSKGEKGMKKQDKILDVKKDMERIYRIPHLTRMEKYNLIYDKCKELDEEELRVLLEESRRDVSANMTDSSKDIINLFFQAVGILIAIAAIFYGKTGMEQGMFIELVKLIGGYSILLIILYNIVRKFNLSSKNKNKYILDILERCYLEEISLERENNE